MDVCAALVVVSRGQLHGLRVQVRGCSYSAHTGLCCRLCLHREGQRKHRVERCELQVLIKRSAAGAGDCVMPDLFWATSALPPKANVARAFMSTHPNWS